MNKCKLYKHNILSYKSNTISPKSEKPVSLAALESVPFAANDGMAKSLVTEVVELGDADVDVDTLVNIVILGRTISGGRD